MVGLVIYGIVTVCVFMIWCGTWLEHKNMYKEWRKRKARHAARMALLAPLWPITLSIVIIHGFFDLVEDAFK
jgi:hypothetical protein